MADRELIAAILTAGILPTLEIPRSRLEGRARPLTRGEAAVIEGAVDHAFPGGVLASPSIGSASGGVVAA
jgi:hypothetical protein